MFVLFNQIVGCYFRLFQNYLYPIEIIGSTNFRKPADLEYFPYFKKFESEALNTSRIRYKRAAFCD